jgi:galactose oxidase
MGELMGALRTGRISVITGRKRWKTPVSPVWLIGSAMLVVATTVSPQNPDAGAGTDWVEDAGRPHHAVVPVASVTAPSLPRTGWTVTADSQETTTLNGAASNAIDGNPATFWHTGTGGSAQLPHTLTIDTHAHPVIAGLVYQPRSDGTARAGGIGQYQIHVSTDGSGWGDPVATGTFADDAAEKTIVFPNTKARHVRLTALTEAGNRGPWSSAAEINLLGFADPTLPRGGWTVTADSQETKAADLSATRAIDGDRSTFWHSEYSTAPAKSLPHTLTIDLHATATVAALKYLPRPPVTGRTGNIGRYQIHLSTDGTTWGTPVATGRFGDDGSEKIVPFPARTARYVRLTGLTEAGERGPWSNAAEINLLSSVDRPDPRLGAWSAGIGFPLVPVAAAQLPDGKLLTWSAYQTDRYWGPTGSTQTAVLDPATGEVTQRVVSETGHDMFCPGTAMLPDGRIMVTGGNDSGKTTIYDPRTRAWTAGPSMNIPRGYQSMTTLADGRVFVLGGSWSGGEGGKDGEVWSPSGGWKGLPGVSAGSLLTADPAGVRAADNHGWFFTWKNNQVFHAGPSRQMNWFDPDGAGTRSAGTRGDDDHAMNGNAVMYDIGRILTVGGSTAYTGGISSDRAYTIDINKGVTVRKLGPMAYPRAMHNSVVLPDGKVLVLGGATQSVPFSDEGSVYNPELWDPATGKFTTMAAHAVPRNYHSVALLLPDGRVFSGGGGLCGECETNHADGQIFTPPYLLKADGTPRSRPSITRAPTTTNAGSRITVTTNRKVTKFALVRLGAVTHTVNNDQRRIPLTVAASKGSQYTLQLPADRGVVLPGNYMLFALDSAGVPSVAKTVRVGLGPAQPDPSMITNLVSSAARR